jgi:integrase
MTQGWRKKLNQLWALCGPWQVKPTPHRFRHTFARLLLQTQGITVRNVAELLGNTEEQVRKRYAKWVPGRQDALSQVVRDGLKNAPKPQVMKVAPKRKVVGIDE